jgi:hypothetical protein
LSTEQPSAGQFAGRVARGALAMALNSRDNAGSETVSV